MEVATSRGDNLGRSQSTGRATALMGRGMPRSNHAAVVRWPESMVSSDMRGDDRDPARDRSYNDMSDAFSMSDTSSEGSALNRSKVRFIGLKET